MSTDLSRLDLTQPWHSLPLAVLDFETTSADPLTCMPVSVAVVRFEGGEEVGHFSSLLDPGVHIPAEAAAIHGITDARVAGAPTLDMVAGRIMSIAGCALPAAYNSAFDRTILHRFVTGADCPMFDPAQEWVCPLVIVKGVDRFVGGKGRHKLEVTCKRWGVELDAAHDALADARAAGRLLWKMRARLGSMSAEKLVASVCKRRAEQEADFAAYKARKANDADAEPVDAATGEVAQ